MASPLRLLCLAMIAVLAGCASATDEIRDMLDRLVENPSAAAAVEVAGLIAREGDVRWAPYLTDLHPFFVESAAAEAIDAALSQMSGLPAPDERVAAQVAFGSWMLSLGIDPGAHYVSWKGKLYAFLDTGFEPLLAQIDDPVLATQLQWGGSTVGGIPELNDPAVEHGADASYLSPEELVFGASLDGDSRAYPLRIMDFHELANDVLGGEPVVLANCTLCRSGTLSLRTVGGQVLDFQTSGLLLNSNKVMVDRQTRSLWRQLTGEAVAGPLRGERLEPLLLTTTTWGDWLAHHPSTRVLTLPSQEAPLRALGGFSYQPGDAYSDYYASDELWFPALDAPDVFAPKTEVAGLSLDEDSLAVSISALAAHGPLLVDVGDASVVAMPTPGGARFYEAPVGGVDLTAAQASDTELALADGTRLPRLASSQAYWFAWWGIHPNTDWWPRSG